VQQGARRGPGRPRAAKSADTRERIILAGREVFSEIGYDAATFQAIALRADLTRPAINHYFSSKKVLYREVLGRTNALVITPAIERAQREAGFIARLSSFIVSVVHADAEHRQAGLFVVASLLESQRHPELRIIENDSVMNSREFLTWAVTDAVERGELSIDSDIASLVEMLTAVVWGVGVYGVFASSQHGLEAITVNLRLLLANKLWRLNVNE
jgi:AcrR family transcriptional regulator